MTSEQRSPVNNGHYFLSLRVVVVHKLNTGETRYSRTQYPRFRLFAIGILFPNLCIRGFFHIYLAHSRFLEIKSYEQT